MGRKLLLEPDKIPDYVRDWLAENELSPEKLATMTAEEAFDEWCRYEGIIGYGWKLRAIMKGLDQGVQC
jgi:hypothetical protein